MVAAPRDKVVRRGRSYRGGIGRLRLRQDRDFTCLDTSIPSGPGELRIPVENRDAQRRLPASGLDVVRAGSQQPNAALRNIDLDGFIFAGLAQMKADSPLRKEYLGDPVAQARDFDLAAVGQVHRIRADPDLAAGSRVCAHRLAGEDRLVQLRINPGASAGGSEVEISRNKADPPDAARR